MEPVVYILQSLKNNRYYIGSTNNFERRYAEHSNGLVKATKNILPLKLVFKQEFADIKIARKIEYRLKKKKSKVIIEKIISDGKIGFIES